MTEEVSQMTPFLSFVTLLPCTLYTTNNVKFSQSWAYGVVVIFFEFKCCNEFSWSWTDGSDWSYDNWKTADGTPAHSFGCAFFESRYRW